MEENILFNQKNDKKEDFIKKIKIGKLNYINKLSFMAKHLNQKLCEVNPSWRYSANLAIKHPWITRNPNDEIPLTFNEILNKDNPYNASERYEAFYQTLLPS